MSFMLNAPLDGCVRPSRLNAAVFPPNRNIPVLVNRTLLLVPVVHFSIGSDMFTSCPTQRLYWLASSSFCSQHKAAERLNSLD